MMKKSMMRKKSMMKTFTFMVSKHSLSRIFTKYRSKLSANSRETVFWQQEKKSENTTCLILTD